MMLRKLKTISDPFKSLCQRNEGLSGLISILRQNSTEGPSTESVASTSSESPKKNINKAMKAYLERAQEHEDFMKKQREEFQIGKRHLANMMGENPETFTQDDIDNAIEYLFPSGLYEKRARPFMKPPEEVFPQRKAAEFDETGRPFHFLFYTGKPNFYQVLYDAVEHMNELNRFEDVMIRKGLEPDPNLKLIIRISVVGQRVS
ncbi:unnamed protein product [Acanthoscelides obtectus]|uniref:Uncharacterized protein n=1 Tax=Acanthoscelides obtectus TaxID=200917 RepID=A0A9P0L6Z0_ACAOB|nr:unnamed protein product [Acanthoscelides obtectus]CAK1630985.1 28S ribosomal protein S9, mitochondrial [Acanthoscelides obtectus]